MADSTISNSYHLLEEGDVEVSGKGRVGRMMANIAVKIEKNGHVRCDCTENPEFWLEFSIPRAWKAQYFLELEEMTRELLQEAETDDDDAEERKICVSRQTFRRLIAKLNEKK